MGVPHVLRNENLDAFGNVKQTLSPQELRNRHWMMFQRSEESLSIYPKKSSSKPVRKKRSAGLLINHH